MNTAPQTGVRFLLPSPTHADTLESLDTILSDEHPAQYSPALSEMVIEMTEAGFAYYFGEALKRSNAGFVISQSANVGLAATLKVMKPVINNIIRRLDDQQIREICLFMQEIMQAENNLQAA